MIKRATNPGIFMKHNKRQIEYMNQHAGKDTDRQIAEVLGLTIMQVSYYRTHMLNIENKSGRRFNEDCSLKDVEQELYALINFHQTYNGCMMDALERRIKLLKNKLL